MIRKNVTELWEFNNADEYQYYLDIFTSSEVWKVLRNGRDGETWFIERQRRFGSLIPNSST
jgi:predicted 3-demethylubiquinone-9 3-methyltransferase (glyoxalase superfamily)